MRTPFQHFALRLFKFSWLFLFVLPGNASDKISLDQYLTRIDIADTFNKRKKGLMFQKSIPGDYGMFFIWNSSKIQCMWMKNTLVPLSVAYIDSQGKIIDIYDMVPLSKASICSSKPLPYALEVNKDWFNDNNINIGDTIDLKNILKK
ncbi:DUF192 domain-containing protein [Gammaproteobacteria bacterium]|nr:DUF192 domain-containing protein [Gammaproteobacteria bacterium]